MDYALTNEAVWSACKPFIAVAALSSHGLAYDLPKECNDTLIIHRVFLFSFSMSPVFPHITDPRPLHSTDVVQFINSPSCNILRIFLVEQPKATFCLIKVLWTIHSFIRSDRSCLVSGSNLENFLNF